MDANKLVDYVYRRTKKQAKIVPQPEPAPEKQEDKKEGDDKPPQEEPKPEEKKEENNNAKDEEKPQEEAKKEEGGENKDAANGEIKEEETKILNYNYEGEGGAIVNFMDDEGIKRMMHYYYQPLYVIERLPPPQLFSDENPNACCIS